MQAHFGTGLPSPCLIRATRTAVQGETRDSKPRLTTLLLLLRSHAHALACRLLLMMRRIAPRPLLQLCCHVLLQTLEVRGLRVQEGRSARPSTSQIVLRWHHGLLQLPREVPRHRPHVLGQLP